MTVVLVLRPSSAQTGPVPAVPASEPPARTTLGDANQMTPTTRIVTQADLQQQVAADRSVAEGLVGHWVPQLSSKRLGLTVHGVTFDYLDIMADFQALRTRFPHSVLIRSDDYSSYRQPDYWVTVLAETYPSAEAANAWCDANGFAAEDCYAHRLSHTDPQLVSSRRRRPS
jgi:serine/threonine-protein kinase